jgi:nitrite reductase/ring-hydroxylating ferredoxin subunit
MISQEENDLLTQTSAGTPCGELMRRYWQPAALSEELTADKPLPVQLFGEELILFRDGAGKPALIGRYCAHQGVDMIYGRVEEDGLRCMYHGWLFDNCGKVVLRGDWLPEKERRWNVGQAAYPCVENGGVIFTYMASGDPPPLAPPELFSLQAENRAVIKAFRSNNYWQAIGSAADPTARLSHFILPNLTLSQAASSDAETVVRWCVPIDDQSYLEYTYQFVGEFPSASDPATVAHEVMLRAIQEMCAERQPRAESIEKTP